MDVQTIGRIVAGILGVAIIGACIWLFYEMIAINNVMRKTRYLTVRVMRNAFRGLLLSGAVLVIAFVVVTVLTITRLLNVDNPSLNILSLDIGEVFFLIVVIAVAVSNHSWRLLTLYGQRPIPPPPPLSDAPQM